MKTDRRSMIVLSFELTGLLLGGVQQKALDLRDPLPQSPDSFCLVNHPHCEQVCWGRRECGWQGGGAARLGVLSRRGGNAVRGRAADKALERRAARGLAACFSRALDAC